jgi:peptidoglycan/xylan/chitin deacetylase (PgdA/CDA1 family)
MTWFPGGARVLNSALRRFCLSASRVSGLQRIFRLNSTGPVVLFYHGVEESIFDAEVQRVHLALPLFERQIAFLRRNREVISLDDLNEGLENGYHLDPRQIVLTFDDGYKNNLRLAAPLLQSWSLPFTIFVSTGHISEHRRFPVYYLRTAILYSEKTQIHLRSMRASFDLSMPERRLSAATSVTEFAKKAPLEVVDALVAECMGLLSHERWSELNAWFISEEPMDWTEVRAASSMGATIGSHCSDHCILHDKQSNEIVHRQLSESKNAIEENVGKCRYFAYPNGTGSDISVSAYRAVKSAQYQLAFTTISGEMTADVNPFLAPRFSAALEYEEFSYVLNRSSKQNRSYDAARPRYSRARPMPTSQGEAL